MSIAESPLPISPIVPERTNLAEKEKERSKLFLAVGEGTVTVVLDGKAKEILSTVSLWPVLKLLAEGTMQKGEDGKSNGTSMKNFIDGARAAGIGGDDTKARINALVSVRKFFDKNFGRKDMIINIITDQSGNKSELISSDARGMGKMSKTVGYKLNAEIFFVRDMDIQRMRENGLIEVKSAKSDSQGVMGEEGDDLGEEPVKVKDYEDVGEGRFILSGAERLILAYWIGRYIANESKNRENEQSLAELAENGITFISGENLIKITGTGIKNIKQIMINNENTYPKDKDERGRIAANVLQKANDFSSSTVDLQRNFISKLDRERDAELICLLNLIKVRGFTDGLMTYIQSLKKIIRRV